MNLENKLLEIKQLIKEESFQSGFNKIQSGDMFVIVTNSHTFNGKVIDKFSTQIVAQIDGKNFLFTNNSLDNDKITGFEMVNGQKISRTVLDVKHIIIRRNGNTITTLTDDDGNNDDFDIDDNQEHGPQLKDILEDCKVILKSIEKDDKLIINIGEVKDEHEMIDKITGVIEIHCRAISEKGVVFGMVTSIKGDINSSLKGIDNDFMELSKTNSLELNDNGVVLKIRNKSMEYFFIEGIMSMEIGEFFNISEPSFDDLMNDNSGFRNLMLKEPSLMGKISGQMAKGVIPANQILKDLGLTHGYFTQGKKVRFTYTGQAIRQGKKLSLQAGKEYVGIFSTSRSIKLTGSVRGENLLVLLKKKTHEQIYEVEVEFHKIRDGEESTKTLGRGIIQIKDINFR